MSFIIIATITIIIIIIIVIIIIFIFIIIIFIILITIFICRCGVSGMLTLCAECLFGLLRGSLQTSTKFSRRAVVEKYKTLVDEDKDKLFNVFQQDMANLLALQIDWKVSMSPREYIYYEDQKTDRKMFL